MQISKWRKKYSPTFLPVGTSTNGWSWGLWVTSYVENDDDVENDDNVNGNADNYDVNDGPTGDDDDYDDSGAGFRLELRNGSSFYLCLGR